jgi:hypothetical protein
VSKITDDINLHVHLLQVDGNEYLKQKISEQQEKIKSFQANNSYLHTVIITNEKRMVPKDYQEHYKQMLYFDSPYVLKLMRRLKDSLKRVFERIKDNPD